MKYLFGPWFGEFGWEIMRWQAFGRWLAQNEGIEIIASSYIDRQFLYEYASVFIPHNIQDYGHPDVWQIHYINQQDKDRTNEFIKSIIRDYKPDSMVRPGRIDPKKQIFKYYQTKEKLYDVVVHARYRTWKQGKNTSKILFKELIDYLISLNLSIAIIGHPKDALSYEHEKITNLLGYPLNEVIHAIASSKLFLGGVSGPVHLACLCSVDKIITWGENIRVFPSGNLEYRLKKDWNPFEKPVEFLKIGFNPSIKELRKYIDKYL